MNSSIVILLVVIAILLKARQRSAPPISAGRFWAVFAAVLMMHAVVIGGLMAYAHFKHS
jgi:hypothetical protein